MMMPGRYHYTIRLFGTNSPNTRHFVPGCSSQRHLALDTGAGQTDPLSNTHTPQPARTDKEPEPQHFLLETELHRSSTKTLVKEFTWL